ncbi:MAG: DsrH/TusB family sulfur metabolism protein [Promethearchaeota archaeon]
MEKILYLFGYSINNYTPLVKIVNIIRQQKELGADISFIFMHDGVIGLTKESKLNDPLLSLIDLNISLYILLPDLKARGINPDKVLDNIIKIEYEILVDLLARNSRIVSWL